MKIGITCYPTYGGSGVVATELGLELAERSHEVHFISYAQPIRLTAPHPNIHYHEVEVSRYPLFDYPPCASPGLGLGALRSRPSARALCDPPFSERTSRAANARRETARAQTSLCDHVARH